jgi:signal peptidase II
MFYAIFGALAAGLLAVDQLVKAWTVATFAAPVPPAIYSTADPALPFLPHRAGLWDIVRNQAT